MKNGSGPDGTEDDGTYTQDSRSSASFDATGPVPLVKSPRGTTTGQAHGTTPKRAGRPMRAMEGRLPPSSQQASSKKAYAEGTARTITVETDPRTGQNAVTFRVETYDRGGNRRKPIPVRIRGVMAGDVADGDQVRVRGPWRDGTIAAETLENLSTGATVKKGHNWALVLVALTAAVIVAVIIGLIAVAIIGSQSRNTFNTPSVTNSAVLVPDVRGKDLPIAMNDLRNSGLRGVVSTEPNAEVPFGHVVRTEPSAGAEVPAGKDVIVIIAGP